MILENYPFTEMIWYYVICASLSIISLLFAFFLLVVANIYVFFSRSWPTDKDTPPKPVAIFLQTLFGVGILMLGSFLAETVYKYQPQVKVNLPKISVPHIKIER